MKNIRKDEAMVLHENFQRVGTVGGKPLVRVYFNHQTEERENMMSEKDENKRNKKLSKLCNYG